MAIKLTPELLRLLNQEAETKDEIKQARAELLREKIKTEKERRAKLSESRKPKAENQPEKVGSGMFALLFVLISGLADVMVLFMLFFMF